MLYLSKGNVLKATIGSVNYGQDRDSIAGCLAAALKRSQEIPLAMMKKVNKANEFNLVKLAEQMQGPIMKVIEEKERVFLDLKLIMR